MGDLDLLEYDHLGGSSSSHMDNDVVTSTMTTTMTTTTATAIAGASSHPLDLPNLYDMMEEGEGGDQSSTYQGHTGLVGMMTSDHRRIRHPSYGSIVVRSSDHHRISPPHGRDDRDNRPGGVVHVDLRDGDGHGDDDDDDDDDDDEVEGNEGGREESYLNRMVPVSQLRRRVVVAQEDPDQDTADSGVSQTQTSYKRRLTGGGRRRLHSPAEHSSKVGIEGVGVGVGVGVG